MPVWGESMLARIVALLRERGVTDIVVNCHYLSDQIVAWCEANNCRVSVEEEILGTGGVLNPLRDWIGSDDFYLVNGDIIVENVPDLEAALAAPLHEAGVTAVGAALVTTEGPRTIEVEPESGLVTCWKSFDPGWNGTFTYCGFALLKAAILDFVEPTGFSTIVQAYERALSDGKFIRAVTAEDLMWADAGTIQSYLELNTDGADNAFADLPQLKAVGFTDKIEFLGARGSDRAFFRSENAIAVVYDDAKRGENAKYAEHARWLKEKGIAVPAVLCDKPELNVTTFEFVGVTDLKTRVEKAGPKTIESYVPVVEELAKFNALDASGLDLEPPFNADLWKWERDLFAEHCLGTRFGRELSKEVENELLRVAERLDAEPRALVHRDFQSTNILWKNGQFSVIDFQGMRLGPAAYDLASLLYDPYVKLTAGERRALAGLYGKKVNRPEILEVLPFAAVQRLVQALGAFGRLASVGQPQFGAFVLPALENLLTVADEANLDALGALAEDLISVEQASSKKSCSCGEHHHHHDGCSCGHHHHED